MGGMHSRVVSADGQLEVLTSATSIEVVLDSSMITVHPAPQAPGRAVSRTAESPPAMFCGCATGLGEETAACVQAWHYPIATVDFRLGAAYDLGVGRFTGIVREIANTLPAVQAKLAQVSGEALCEFYVRVVDITTLHGTLVRFHLPAIRVVGPWRPPLPGTAS
ncbi:hypothetical protein ACPA54_12845 [Uniformispora flossi]|uniref:hypothetical protein n=1 Tax=Uniformispora flossi TaxID=3390723 RepID=UPI003C2EA780